MLDMMETSHSYDKHVNYKDTMKMHLNSSNSNLHNDPCRICGFNQNTGRNFGVISCSTCKAFFRRNGRNASAIPPCRFGGNCPVNERTRRQCPACRLTKCFAVGMQKDLIRTDEERAARLQLVRANRLHRTDKPRPQITSHVNEKFISTSLRTLTANDWIQLTNIRSAYEQFCLHPILRAEEEREDYLNTLPMKYRLKEHSFLNVLRMKLSSLCTFFQATVPVLSTEINRHDRQWLTRTNLRHLLLFSSMDLMNINGNQLHFHFHRACYHVYLYVYGQELLAREDYFIQKLNSCIGFDPIISKLMQIILFLSPCLITPLNHSYQPPLKTILNIHHAQKQYTEVFWLYLVYRYGQLEAQKLFVSIIGQVLQHQKHGADIDQSLAERQPFGNLVYSLLTTFSID